MIEPTPVQSVRPAGPEDAETIADLQVKSVVDTVVAVVGEEYRATIDSQMDRPQVAQTWLDTIRQGANAPHAVMVAREGDEVVGFTAFSATSLTSASKPDSFPFSVPDGSAQILAFEVDDEYRQKGHGSRMLSAIADTAVNQRVPGLLVWIVGEDEDRVRFFQKAGFAPAGLRRQVDTGAGVVTEHLWFAALD